jgi:glycine cleavage system H lipoate-binding protein
MSVILGLLFLAMAIGIGVWRQRKTSTAREKEAMTVKLAPSWKGIFVHPGHAWVEVIEPSLVAIGTDQFTRSVFGSVERLTLPQPGTMIQQGGKGWSLKRGTRELVQTSPISGRVEEINQELVQNPRLLAQKDAERSWMLKIRPLRLKSELKNLLSGNMSRQWNQAVKDRLVATLTTAQFPVLQEGGEIKPDLGDELTSEQWEKITAEFFNPTQIVNK